LPAVSVPVLSNTILRMSFNTWNASPERIRMPRSAAMPPPRIIARGVAIPSAQG
jgi:hypothetical protein